jgi:transposase
MMFFPGVLDQVFIATGATDMRKSINGLSIMVAEQLELNPLSGHLFCFCNRKRDIIKILYWDRTGFCLWHKRLEKDRFRWPENEADAIEMQGRELSWLLEGLNADQCAAHRQLSYESVI